MLTLWADACADEQNRDETDKGGKLYADTDADTLVDADAEVNADADFCSDPVAFSRRGHCHPRQL